MKKSKSSFFKKSVEIVIISDHQIFGNLLVEYLKTQRINCNFQLKNSTDLLLQMEKKQIKPDAIILYELTKESANDSLGFCTLMSKHPSLRIIVQSNFANHVVAKYCHELGCFAFLTKNDSIDLLMEAISMAQNGKKLNKTLSASHQNEATEFQLTQRELCLIKLITIGKSNREIAAALFRSVKTVELNRLSLYRKLNVYCLPEFIKVVTANGLDFLETKADSLNLWN